jgi:cyclohexanecarboxyl-CoA dehydrogenase
MTFLSKDQNKFRKKIRKFARQELTQHAQKRAKLDHVTSDVIYKLSAEGLFKMTTPTRYGGRPKDSVCIGLAFEEVCAVDWSPMALLLSHTLTPILLKWASEEVKAEWLPLFTSGKKLVCFGNTEPECGSDAAAIKTRAVREDSFYVISGEKTSISGGMQADAIVMTAKTEPDAGPSGITCFFVPLDLKGVGRSRYHDMGSIPATRASIFFDAVRIPEKFRIGHEGQGFIKVMKGLDFGRVLVVLAGVGLAKASLAEAISFVKQRRAFGNPISKYESVSFKLAEAATLLEASRLLCYNCLKLRDEGLPHRKESAMAKWYGASACVRALHEILVVFGAQGYSQSLPLEQRFRDLMGLKLGDGTEEIMKLIIAREMLGGQFGSTILI